MSNDLGIDRSGNNNSWTVNNITYTDQMIDTPTNNFATQNPLCNAISNAPDSGDASPTFSQGNLRIVTALTPAGRNASTIGVLSGKYYAEMYHEAGVSGEWVSPRNIIGITTNLVDSIQSKNGGNIGNLTTSEDVGYSGQSGNKNVGNSWTSYGATWAIGDIIGVALNMDDEEVTFYKNNASQGAISFTASGEGHFMSGDTSAGGGLTAVWNYGQDSSFAGNKTAQGNQDSNGIGDFYYTPPTGFLALCTKNLPDVAVVPSEHFNTILWSGNSSSNTVTGMGFDAGLWWNKVRNVADAHILIDEVRGDNEVLRANTNGSEYGNGVGFTSNSDGFSMTTTSGEMNHSGRTYVTWGWKGSGGSGSSNTDGDIDSTISANTDAKFSIVKYTGVGGEPKTVAHGLGVSPEMVIIKKRNNSGSWVVWHKDLADNYAFEGLDTTGAAISGGSPISKYVDAVSSTLVTLGDAGENNADNDTFIMYCWASIDGYSKVGSYIGNGLVDGTFIYTGFRPAWVMWKRSDVANDWHIKDTSRAPYNVMQAFLQANESLAENTSSDAWQADNYSNGFKLRNGNTEGNAKGGYYIYIAFAEIPFKYSNAR